MKEGKGKEKEPLLGPPLRPGFCLRNCGVGERDNVRTSLDAGLKIIVRTENATWNDESKMRPNNLLTIVSAQNPSCA